MIRRPVSLPIVAPSDALLGVAAPGLERAVRTSRVGDETHRGLLFTCETIARFAIRACIPPSSAERFVRSAEVAGQWARQQRSLADVKAERSAAFDELPSAEQRAAAAVGASLTARSAATALDEHADRVVLRYVALAANYAASTALLLLDGVTDPPQLLHIPKQAAGGLAYQAAALRAARSPQFRALAIEHAEWEHGRPGADASHASSALALQLFHEFLGVCWKDHSDAQRAYFDDFLAWALGHSLH